jgi:trehalose synthase
VIREIPVERKRSLDDYASVAHLASAVRELEREARLLVPKLEGRTVWMVNSTAEGGGVAEMLPRVVSLLGQLGVQTRWVVIGTDRDGFFPLTKRIHNLIHGSGDPGLSPDDRALYEAVSSELAAELAPMLAPGDLLVVHDPQPAGMGAKLAESMDLHAIWRSHIGLDRSTSETRAAWSFLRPYLEAYEHSVFTLADYMPSFLRGSVSVITPGLDPLSHKNRELSTHKLVGVLACSKLIPAYGPMLVPAFERPAQRLQPDGSFRPISDADDLGLLFRPIVSQISRWDRLKGWRPLLEGFAELKRDLPARLGQHGDRERRALELVRLVLAGPETAAIADDPEAAEVFDELCALWRGLEAQIQSEIAVVSLPMQSRKHNALMVNSIQRCSSVIAQNSLQEGFGLTVTEAMWKRVAVLGSSACGIRRQIRDGIDGKIVRDPEDRGEIADAIEELLCDPRRREALARTAQRRAHDDFLVFSQIRAWLRLLADRVAPPSGRRPPA